MGEWGIWVHGGIDGYSRYVIYLEATTNKKPGTVNTIFVKACNMYGWPSRGRWDKGTENRGAMLSLIDHHYDPARPSTLTRGSAITGHSTQNTRIEYLWRFLTLLEHDLALCALTLLSPFLVVQICSCTCDRQISVTVWDHAV